MVTKAELWQETMGMNALPLYWGVNDFSDNSWLNVRRPAHRLLQCDEGSIAKQKFKATTLFTVLMSVCVPALNISGQRHRERECPAGEIEYKLLQSFYGRRP